MATGGLFDLGAVGGQLALIGERYSNVGIGGYEVSPIYDDRAYQLMKVLGDWVVRAGGGGNVVQAPSSAPVPTILAPAAPVVPATKPATEALGRALSVGKRGGIRPLFGPAWEGDRR